MNASRKTFSFGTSLLLGNDGEELIDPTNLEVYISIFNKTQQNIEVEPENRFYWENSYPHKRKTNFSLKENETEDKKILARHTLYVRDFSFATRKNFQRVRKMKFLIF